MANASNVKAYDRYLSRSDVWGLAFGCMVGWGVFAMPGSTFLPVAGPLGTIISFAIGTVIMLVISASFSYLMSRSSVTGGIYSYAKEAFGRDHAFICAWFLCLSYLTIVFLNGTALFLVVRTLLSDISQTGIHYDIAGTTIYLRETAISILILALTGGLFVVAKPFLQKVHTVLSYILLAGIIITSLFCLPAAFKSGNIASFGSSGTNPVFGVLSLVILAPWAFVGFETVSFDTAHFRFPTGETKRIIVWAIIAAAFAYTSTTIMSVAVVPDGYASWQAYISSSGEITGVVSVPTFHAALSLMGPVGLVIMTITAISAILTGIIGGYRATTRVLSTMAEDHILSDAFSKTTYSILFIMVISILLSTLGLKTLDWFVDLTSFGAIVGFGYTSAAAYKLARAENKRKYTITGLLGLIISIIFIIVQLIPNTAAMEAMNRESFLLLSLWCLLGFVFYWRTVNRSTLAEYSGISASGVILFALLLYSALMWLGKNLMSATSLEQSRKTLFSGGAVVMIIIFVGLLVMLYVQNVVRIKHEAAEREKIRAVESSLAKSQFLFNMSHDIRTPMNAIIGYTNLALQEDTSEAVHNYLEKIDSSSQHLLALINDILEMSRIESGRIELELSPINLCSVFEGIDSLFSQQMIQKEMDFHVYTSQVKNRYVWCDRKNLNRILLNIISNSYKFTPAGGTISVSLWEIGTGENGYGSYEIRIQDNGIGMSKEFAERMFSAFERERTSTVSGIEGTGLGLSITKAIIDMMGGTIEVITAPGNGTEMIIRLQLRLASETDLTEQTQTAENDKEEKMDFSTKKLLIVEDNEVNMEIAKMILTQAGFQTDTAENGAIALEKVRSEPAGTYDAILMDIQMPVMNGHEAAKAIRALDDRQKSSIPILAMTANAFAEDVEAALRSGMQAHIAKPIDISTMMATLTEVLKAAEKH